MSDDVTLLARILGMMGSDSDGEKLNAARAAERQRIKMKKTWEQILKGGDSGASDTFGSILRAVRAEARADELQRKVTRLEQELSTLRAQRSTHEAHTRKRGLGRGPSPMLAAAIALATRAEGVTREELRDVSPKQQPWTQMLKDAERFGYRFWSEKRRYRYGKSVTVYHLDR